LIRDRLTSLLQPPREPHLPLRVEGCTAGWIYPHRAARLARFDDVFVRASDGLAVHPQLETAEQRTSALDHVARTLAGEGALSPWRDERYAVAPCFSAPPWFLLERAAARYFGIHTYAAHVNGLVRRDDGIALWFARRSPTKAIDPNRLDNLVGGGVAAGHAVASAVIKEAWEESGIPAPLARRATSTGPVHVCRDQPDGLQHETIFVHDLWLPPDFVPQAQDGEVVEHRLVDLARAAELIAQTEGPDVVTADASLVILDCLLRQGAIAPDAAEFLALAAMRHPAMAGAVGRIGPNFSASCRAGWRHL
jgi:8-oxo-dGTP pyrophosphatase MutT (NUDIX family)